jgi:hypothetical protein
MSDLVRILVGTPTGRKYLIKYQLDGQRVPRFAVARLLEIDDEVYVFSGRPQFGTFRLNRSQIIGIEQLSENATCYFDSKKIR